MKKYTIKKYALKARNEFSFVSLESPIKYNDSNNLV